MSLAALMNRPCTITRNLESGEIDVYGSGVPTETYVETVCEIQQERRDEPEAQAESSETTWRGFFPTGTIARTGDTVSVTGLAEFEMVGDPWDANTGSLDMHHVEATLKRTGGSEDAS